MVILIFKVNDKIYSITLNNVKHAPEAPNNLISIGCLSGSDHSENFTPAGVEFKIKSGLIFGFGCKIGDMHQMRVRVKRASQTKDFVAVANGHTWNKWHRILGHVNIWTVKMLKTHNLVTGLHVNESQEPTQCIACIQAKRHVEPFPKEAMEIVEKTGDLIVSDVWGPARMEGSAHEKYFYSYTDVKSRYLAVYFGNTKDEALKHFETFKAFVETQTGHKLNRFRSDNSGEYIINKTFKDFCAKYGIITETTVPYSPVQNGIAE